MAYTVHNLQIARQALQTNLGIARGDYKDLSHINKFGFNDTVGTAFETIWDGSTVYSYPATAGTIQLTSDDTDDNTSTVLVQGLDANYNEVSETLTVGGARGTQQFIRVFRMQMITAATGGVNQGVITALHTQADSTDTEVAKITAEFGQTLMANYTVPARKRAYLTQMQVTSTKDNKACMVGLFVKNGTGSFNCKQLVEVYRNVVTTEFTVPLVFEGKIDIELRGKNLNTGNVSIGGSFQLILEDKP